MLDTQGVVSAHEGEDGPATHVATLRRFPHTGVASVHTLS